MATKINTGNKVELTTMKEAKANEKEADVALTKIAINYILKKQQQNN